MFGSEKKKRRSDLHEHYSSGSGKKRSIECTHERYTLPTYKRGRYYQQCYNCQPSRVSSAQKKKYATDLLKDAQHVMNLFVRNVGMLAMTMSVIGIGLHKYWNAKQ